MKEQVQEIAKELGVLKEKIDLNFNNINKNREDIDHNTGAVALLHTLNANSNKYFVIWIITFFALLMAVGYIIYLHNDIATIETSTQEISDFENINGNIVNRGDMYGQN